MAKPVTSASPTEQSDLATFPKLVKDLYENKIMFSHYGMKIRSQAGQTGMMHFDATFGNKAGKPCILKHAVFFPCIVMFLNQMFSADRPDMGTCWVLRRHLSRPTRISKNPRRKKNLQGAGPTDLKDQKPCDSPTIWRYCSFGMS